MTEHNDTNDQPSSEWHFDPNKPRPSALFNSFTKRKGFCSKVVKNIEATPLGRRLVDFARRVDPLILFEDTPFYSVYIPQEHNLEAGRLTGDGVLHTDRPAFLLDNQDIDETLLPYILTSEMFHLMQDKMEPDENRLLPMFQNSIVYNGVTRIDDVDAFVRFYEDMERACDVVSLVVLYQMSRMGVDSKAFGLMDAQPHLHDICRTIAQTGAFIEKSGIGEQDAQLAEDLILLMGNLAGMQSASYKERLTAQALKAYETTMANEGFAIIAGEEPIQAYEEGDEGDIEYGDELEAFFDDPEFIDFVENQQLDISGEYSDDDDDIIDDYDDEGAQYHIPPHNSYNFSLLTDSYANRQWDIAGWIEKINQFLELEKTVRAEQLNSIFQGVAERAEDAKQTTDHEQDRDKATPVAPKAKTPKGPKKP